MEPKGKVMSHSIVIFGFSKRKQVAVVIVFAQKNQKPIPVRRKKPKRGTRNTKVIPAIVAGQAKNLSANDFLDRKTIRETMPISAINI